MPEFAYLGSAPATYPQYLAVLPDGTTPPLTAEPGGSYAMRPVPGYQNADGTSALPVPPDDGRWAAVSRKTASAATAARSKPKEA